MDTKKLTRISMLLSLSIVLGIVESFLPLFDGSIPGLKIGLANIVVIFALYSYGLKDAIFISIVRVFVVGLLRTGLFNYPFFFSLSGALISVLIMGLLKRTKIFSVTGISVCGALSHNIAQILTAYLLLNTASIFVYLPYLLLFSIPCGIITGIISKKLLKYYDI